MKKSPFLFILGFFLVIPIVMGLQISNTLLESVNLNTSINITYEWNLTDFTIDTDSIYISNLNVSNPASVNLVGDSVSFNITSGNRRILGTDVPFFNYSDGVKKVITSRLDDELDLQLKFKVDNCNIIKIIYEPVNLTMHTTLTATNFSCSGNIVSLNVTNIGKGANVFYIDDNAIINCTAGNITANIFIFDEQAPTSAQVADVDVEILYWRTPSYRKNFTVKLVGANNYSLCLQSNISSIDADLYLKYNTTGGFSHRHYSFNQTFNATVQNITLYNFITTAGISTLDITTRYTSNYNYYPNVVGNLLRHYVDEGVWRVVQMDKSGDFGRIVYNIVEKSVDYKIIFTNLLEQTLKTTESMKFICTDGVCDLTVMLDPYSVTTTTTDIQISWDYNAAVGNITTLWNDPSLSTSTVRTLIQKPSPTGRIVLCDSNQTGSSGTNTCVVAAYTGTVEYLIFDDEEIVISEWITLNSTKMGIMVGDDEGGIWAAMLLVSVVMFGAAISPVGAIMALIFGLVVISLLGLFTPITLTFVISASVAAIFIGFLVKK
ncbi:MAG: hypothetical protein ACTSPI_13465 [Candidatus Heimdallarchaeaceae archaeon]